jgi:hypothetical protein
MREAALAALTLVFALPPGVTPATANVGGKVGAEQQPDGDPVFVGPHAELQQLGGSGRATGN